MTKSAFKNFTIGICALALSLQSSVAAIASEELASADQMVLHGSASQGLDLIDASIAKKEVELIKLNSDFRTHYMSREKNKQRRMKAYDFAAGAVANAGDITLISQFWKYQRQPGAGLAHRGRLEAGVITVLVAYCLLGGMYTAEGAGDLISDFRSKTKHFDAKSMRERVVAIKNDLDKLLADRAVAVSQITDISESEKQYLTAEETVLKDLRDLSILEFSKLYIDSRKRHSQRDITTIGTLAVCATGAFPGALGILAGLRHVNPKQIGGGGIGFLISGATLTAAPALIYGGGAVSGKVAGDRLSRELGELQCQSTSKLHSDTERLAKLMPGTTLTAGVQSRLSTYQELDKFMAERASFLDQDRRLQKQDMIESFISYAAKGGPQIGFGTCVTRAGYRWGRNPYKLFKGVASGATANEASWGIWMLDVMQKQTRNEFRNREAANLGDKAPFSTANEDMKRLEAIKMPTGQSL